MKVWKYINKIADTLRQNDLIQNETYIFEHCGTVTAYTAANKISPNIENVL